MFDKIAVVFKDGSTYVLNGVKKIRHDVDTITFFMDKREKKYSYNEINGYERQVG